MIYAGFDTGADVDWSGHRSRHRGDIRTHHVANVNVVAGLLTIAENCHWFILEQASTENRDHPRLPMGILARSIDICVAHRGVVNSVLRLV